MDGSLFSRGLTAGDAGKGCMQVQPAAARYMPTSLCRQQPQLTLSECTCMVSIPAQHTIVLAACCAGRAAASKLPYAGGCSRQQCTQEPVCAASTATICTTVGCAYHWRLCCLRPHLVTIHHLDDHALPQVGIQDDSLAALLPHDHPRPACTTQQSAVSAVPACPMNQPAHCKATQAADTVAASLVQSQQCRLTDKFSAAKLPSLSMALRLQMAPS